MVWLTPDFFNLALVTFGFFFWATRRSRRTPCRRHLARPVGWFLRQPVGRDRRPLLGIATFSKPLNVLAAAPVLWLALLRRQWRRMALISIAFVAVTGGLFRVNGVSSGDRNYQGGDPDRHVLRAVPVPDAGRDVRDHRRRARHRRPADRRPLRPRRAVDVFRHNLGYFVVGRHTGFVPYFFPGILTLGALPLRRPAAARALPVAGAAGARARLGRAPPLHAVHVLGRRRSGRQSLLPRRLRRVPVPHAAARPRCARPWRRPRSAGCSRRR